MTTQPEAARLHLQNSEALAYQVQQELTALIQSSRLSVLSEKGLATALQEYVTTWSRQQQIPVQQHVDACTLPPLTELVEAVRKAARGESALHPRVASRIIQEVREFKPAVPAAFVELTARELDVLRLIAEGESNATIAEKLVLSEKTVKGHVSNILSKLHIADRTQAAALAWQQGLMVQ